jgi:hypothetical protein
VYSHPNIINIEVEAEIPPKHESGHTTFLYVTRDAEIDPSSPKFDPVLVFDIKTAAIHDWVDIRKQPPETEVRLVRGNSPQA